jgi:hypothetical protein
LHDPRGAEAVELVAEPAEGSVFGGWKTDPPTACDGSLELVCTLEVHANVSVRAYMVKDGANVWARLAGTSEGSFATTFGVANSSDGSSFLVAEFNGQLANLQVLAAKADSDVVVAKVSRAGQFVVAGTLSTTGPDTTTDVAATSFGVVVAGYAVGLGDTTVALEPLGKSIETDGAFVVAYDSELEPRWSWVVGGQGATTVQRVEVSSDDTTVVLGTFGYSLIASTATFTSEEPGEVFLAAVDANGNEKWVAELADLETDRGLHLAMQPSGSFVIAATAGVAADLGPLGGDCEPTPEGVFLARFAPTGQCLQVLALPENISTVAALAVDDEGNVYVASHFVDFLEVGDRSFSTLDQEAIVLLRLAPDLAWEDGVSWATMIDGTAKFSALGVSQSGVTFGINGQGALTIDDSPFEPPAPRTFQLGKLDSSGKLEWFRTLGDSPSAWIRALGWDPSARLWVAAGSIASDQFRPFDFENVTDSGRSISGTDSFIARFAD